MARTVHIIGAGVAGLSSAVELTEQPHAQPLDSKQMVDAFRIWDQQVGAAKTK